MKAKIIVFTNGCFDLLHEGHVYLLNECSKLGDELIVGINSDDSVKRLKGDSRPIQSEKERKKALLKLDIVDKVIIFDDDTPYRLLEEVKADILVKGGEYSHDEIVGTELVRKTVRVPMLSGVSTTNIIEKRKKMHVIYPETYEKVWGSEKWLCNIDLYCSKILYLNKGYRCSYHYHKIKDEAFHILKGTILMVINGSMMALEVGHTVRIEPGDVHSFTGLEDSEILEVSTKHMEDDSYRKSESGEAWTIKEWGEFLKEN